MYLATQNPSLSTGIARCLPEVVAAALSVIPFRRRLTAGSITVSGPAFGGVKYRGSGTRGGGIMGASSALGRRARSFEQFATDATPPFS